MAQKTQIRVLEEREIKGKKLFVFPVLEDLGVRNGVSTRDFGSEEEFLSALKIPAASWTSAEQVHRDWIVEVTSKNMGTKNISGADGLVTNLPHVPLTIRTADCLAITLFDPENQVLGMAHAGWRGSFMRIGEKLIGEMKNRYGTNPHIATATLGPSIGGCCYTVTENVLEPLRKEFPDSAKYVYEENGETHLDLKALNKEQLKRAGIPPENIHMSLFCTSCMSDHFFSYRKEGVGVGRLFTVGMIEG